MARARVTDNDGEFVVTEGDRLLRESFALGFVVLLVLVAGLGYLSIRRIGAVEETITERSARNQATLEIVFRLEEQTGLLAAEGKTLLTARSANLRTGPVERRISSVEKDLAETLDRGRTLDIGDTPEWREFERALGVYAEGLARPEPNTDLVNEDFDKAMHGLRELAQRDVRRLSDDADAMRKAAQRDIGIATAVCLAAGLVVSVLAFVETRRRMQQLRRAYAQVRLSKRLSESTLEGMTSAVLTVDHNGIVTRINGHALHVLEIPTADAAMDRSIGALVQARTLRQALEPLSRGGSIAHGYLGRFELGSEHRLFDVGVAPLLIESETSGHIVTLTDVTDAERANDELRRGRALAAVGQMTAQVAHEIKNPLGSVGLAAQVLELRVANDDVALDVVHRIENSVDHLTRIVGELSQFARPIELTTETVDVRRLIDDVLASIDDRIIEKSIRVVRTHTVETLPVELDAKEIRKAMLNVLINAVDASEEGASIEVTLERQTEAAGAMVFAVTDHGQGMDDETLRRLFEPFFTTKARGTGLGMAITRNIVELHNGTIAVDSSPGRGTTVTLTLPLVPVSNPLVGAREVR